MFALSTGKKFRLLPCCVLSVMKQIKTFLLYSAWPTVKVDKGYCTIHRQNSCPRSEPGGRCGCDTGEVVSIERNEIGLERDTVWMKKPLHGDRNGCEECIHSEGRCGGDYAIIYNTLNRDTPAANSKQFRISIVSCVARTHRRWETARGSPSTAVLQRQTL